MQKKNKVFYIPNAVHTSFKSPAFAQIHTVNAIVTFMLSITTNFVIPHVTCIAEFFVYFEP